MSYLFHVTFTSANKPDITLTDILDPDDWSCANYWDDIGDTISCLIATAERKLSQIFPNGHDYILSEVRAVYLEDDEE